MPSGQITEKSLKYHTATWPRLSGITEKSHLGRSKNPCCSRLPGNLTLKYIYACMHACLCTCVCHMHIAVYTYIHTCMHACMHAYMRTYIQAINTHRGTYMHTHMCLSRIAGITDCRCMPKESFGCVQSRYSTSTPRASPRIHKHFPVAALKSAKWAPRSNGAHPDLLLESMGRLCCMSASTCHPGYTLSRWLDGRGLHTTNTGSRGPSKPCLDKFGLRLRSPCLA